MLLCCYVEYSTCYNSKSDWGSKSGVSSGGVIFFLLQSAKWWLKCGADESMVNIFPYWWNGFISIIGQASTFSRMTHSQNMSHHLFPSIVIWMGTMRISKITNRVAVLISSLQLFTYIMPEGEPRTIIILALTSLALNEVQQLMNRHPAC